MQAVRETPTVKGLTENNFALIRQTGNSVAAILDRPNIAMLRKVVDPNLLELFIATEIGLLVDSVNIDQRLTIQTHQAPIIAAQLVNDFPVETLEDFVLCFKRGSTGYYGSIYRLDAAVLNEWMRTYLEEKYSLVEAEILKTKTQELENTVDYKAFIERKQKEKDIPRPLPENFKENEYQRFKLDRQTKLDFQKKLLHASIEFYKDINVDNPLNAYEDENGNSIYAANESDAEKIYALANL